MNENIDWEQRRYEIAKHMLSYNIHYTPKELAVKAVSYADALIKELKKGGEK